MESYKSIIENMVFHILSLHEAMNREQEEKTTHLPGNLK